MVAPLQANRNTNLPYNYSCVVHKTSDRLLHFHKSKHVWTAPEYRITPKRMVFIAGRKDKACSRRPNVQTALIEYLCKNITFWPILFEVTHLSTIAVHAISSFTYALYNISRHFLKKPCSTTVWNIKVLKCCNCSTLPWWQSYQLCHLKKFFKNLK